MSAFTVAITGGIASGKSEVTRRFQALGVAVADADLLARQLVEPGAPALAAIVERFGGSVLGGDGTLDRAALRLRVFDDVPARRDLESILHPRIREALRRSCEAADSPYAMAAIPLLAEGGGRRAYPWLDQILVIDVPREMQLARLLRRDEIDQALAERMLAAQADRHARLAIADDLIENTGSLEVLDAQVRSLHQRYLALSAAR